MLGVVAQCMAEIVVLANKGGVPLPVIERTRALDDDTSKAEYEGQDFAVLLFEQAKMSGLEIEPENVDVGTGL